MRTLDQLIHDASQLRVDAPMHMTGDECRLVIEEMFRGSGYGNRSAFNEWDWYFKKSMRAIHNGTAVMIGRPIVLCPGIVDDGDPGLD